MRHTIPGKSLKKTGGTFKWRIPFVSRIQGIISTQATERDSGAMRIFQDWYFLLCWVSSSFHHFSAAATIGKRIWKKRKQLSRDICPYVVQIFVFTSLYSTLWKTMVRLSVLFVFLWTFSSVSEEVLICTQILPIQSHSAKPHSAVIKSDKKPSQTRTNRWCASYDNL